MTEVAAPTSAIDVAGRVFWLTGLSGSGKTTVATLLVNWFMGLGIHPVLLDGDVIRDLLLEPAGHDRGSRLKIARFNARLCRFLSVQGLTVVCPTISLFHEVQAWNRQHVPGYVEILLDTPLEELRRRDPKGIYAKASRGEIHDVVGVDLPAEFPTKPDLRINFVEGRSPAAILEHLIDSLHLNP